MTKPSPAEVETRVIHDVAKGANLPIKSIHLGDVLAKIGVDHMGFVFIAASLRAYIQHTSPNNSLLVSEVEKSGLTVLQLRDLVAARV